MGTLFFLYIFVHWGCSASQFSWSHISALVSQSLEEWRQPPTSIVVGIKELFYEEKYRIDMVTHGKPQEMQKKGCEVVLYSLAIDPAFKDFNHSSGLCRNLLSLEAVKSTRSDINFVT